MPMQRIEETSGIVSVWGAVITVMGNVVGWISANSTLCGLLIAFVGLSIQALVAAHGAKVRARDEARKDAEEARNRADDARRSEEHLLRMAILHRQYETREPL